MINLVIFEEIVNEVWSSVIEKDKEILKGYAVEVMNKPTEDVLRTINYTTNVDDTILMYPDYSNKVFTLYLDNIIEYLVEGEKYSLAEFLIRIKDLLHLMLLGSVTPIHAGENPNIIIKEEN